MFRHILIATTAAFVASGALAQSVTDDAQGVTRANPGEIIEANTPNSDRIDPGVDRRMSDMDARIADTETRLERLEARLADTQGSVERAGTEPGSITEANSPNSDRLPASATQ